MFVGIGLCLDGNVSIGKNGLNFGGGVTIGVGIGASGGLSVGGGIDHSSNVSNPNVTIRGKLGAEANIPGAGIGGGIEGSYNRDSGVWGAGGSIGNHSVSGYSDGSVEYNYSPGSVGAIGFIGVRYGK